MVVFTYKEGLTTRNVVEMTFFSCCGNDVTEVTVRLTSTTVKIYRGYLLILGEYQIYFIEWGEKISIFHECKCTYFHHTI